MFLLLFPAEFPQFGAPDWYGLEMGPKKAGRQPRKARKDVRIREILYDNEKAADTKAISDLLDAPVQCECMIKGPDNRPHPVTGKLELEHHKQWLELEKSVLKGKEDAIRETVSPDEAAAAIEILALDERHVVKKGYNMLGKRKPKCTEPQVAAAPRPPQPPKVSAHVHGGTPKKAPEDIRTRRRTGRRKRSSRASSRRLSTPLADGGVPDGLVADELSATGKSLIS